MKPGTLYYEKEMKYYGIVLEINIVEKTIVSATNIVISKHEYRVISLTEQGLKLNKFWTLDEHDKNLKREFSWRIIC
jgi:hypothetical protein